MRKKIKKALCAIKHYDHFLAVGRQAAHATVFRHAITHSEENAVFMNEQNEIRCEGNNLSLEVNYIPQILVPTMCKRRINWIKDNKTLGRMVIEESLLLHRFETEMCFISGGGNEHGLGMLAEVGSGRGKGASLQ